MTNSSENLHESDSCNGESWRRWEWGREGMQQFSRIFTVNELAILGNVYMSFIKKKKKVFIIPRGICTFDNFLATIVKAMPLKKTFYILQIIRPGCKCRALHCSAADLVVGLQTLLLGQ